MPKLEEKQEIEDIKNRERVKKKLGIGKKIEPIKNTGNMQDDLFLRLERMVKNRNWKLRY